MKRRPKPLPCPCCGKEELYVGKVESCTLGVQCQRYFGGCGLMIARRYPERMPRGVGTLAELDRRLTVEAILAWNRREGQ